MGCAASTTAITTQQQAAEWFAKPVRRTALFSGEPVAIHRVDVAGTEEIHARYEGDDTDPIAYVSLAAPKLRVLELRRNSAVTGRPGPQSTVSTPLVHFARHATNLTELRLTDFPNLEDAHAAAMINALPCPEKLRCVSLVECEHLEGATALALARCTGLEELTLDGSSIDDDMLAHLVPSLAKLRRLVPADRMIKTLTALVEAGLTNVSLPPQRKLVHVVDLPAGGWADDFATFLPALDVWKELEDIKLKGVDDRAVDALASHGMLPRVMEMWFEDAAVTGDALGRLVKNLPNLTRVYVAGCTLSGAFFRSLLDNRIPVKELCVGESSCMDGEQDLADWKAFAEVYVTKMRDVRVQSQSPMGRVYLAVLEEAKRRRS